VPAQRVPWSGTGKTCTVHLARGGQGLDFLGFHHRKVESWRRRGRFHLQRRPSRRAMGVLRDKIRAATGRRQVGRPLTAVIADLNPFLRGWSAHVRWNLRRVAAHAGR
jgi:RNA-directed DNA polymerase